MSRSWIRLRRVLFGVSCAVVFGFGAADAATASRETQAMACSCRASPYPYLVFCSQCPSGVAACDGRSPTPVCEDSRSHAGYGG
jgi:hypothetical protein